MINRDVVIKIAWSYLGKFYKWGGDDPSGFDCSGLVVECLKSIGLLSRKSDYTAQGLKDLFMWGTRPEGEKPEAGDLVFWTNEDGDRIIHVEICINSRLSIGASGGGSRTVTEADAIRDNAYIKVRPFKSRQNLWGFINPYG